MDLNWNLQTIVQIAETEDENATIEDEMARWECSQATMRMSTPEGDR
jgi:hypothetical protein